MDEKHTIGMILQQNEFRKSNRKRLEKCIKPELFCCAYREYDEKSGATGGPAGVLYTQKSLIGNRLHDVPIHYIFRPVNYRVDETVWKQMALLNMKTKTILGGAYHLVHCTELKENIEKGVLPLVVCHEMGSAYGAYLLGVPYTIVYHQQGSILNEIRAIPEEPHKEDEDVIHFMEAEVMKGAHKVYFPSMGAKKFFLETSTLTKEEAKKIPFAETPLYNTIPPYNQIGDLKALKKEYSIELDGTEEIFLSVGDYNYDKGMDLVPSFLQEYVALSGKKIVWIAFGLAITDDIFDKISQGKDSWNFKSYLFNKRIEHQKILEFMFFANYYIMLHRNAVFDIATLEAMQAKCGMVLSDVMGNCEFNIQNNVILVNQSNRKAAVKALLHKDINKWKYSNQKVFEKCFSNEHFRDNYRCLLEDFVCSKYQKQISDINVENLSTWRNRFKGKKVVICGSGSSLDSLKSQERDCIYIALNKALFYQHIKFDLLFMQDMPVDQNHVLKDYNSYPCDKFYGVITNPSFQGMGLGNEHTVFQSVNGNIYRYELAPYVYQYHLEQMEMDIDRYCLSDAQSVLFSALQFAVFAGAAEIALCGVDFSSVNYGNIKNTSRYARNVVNNLIAYKNQLTRCKPEIKFYFLDTCNEKLKSAFYDIDHEEEEIIVSGLYTDNYADMVRLQEQSCRDGYLFDFKHISDAEWNRRKSSEDFAFFNGNTIKTELVIDKIKEYWGKYLLITDADVIFLNKTREILLYELRNADMLFLRERLNENNLYERASANVNIGFVCMRCNAHSLSFWEEVQKKVEDNKGWDQEIVNDMLHLNPKRWKYKLLPDCFLNGGDINKDNISVQKICTSCGTIARRNGMEKYEYLLRAYSLAQKKEWFDSEEQNV